MIRTRSQAASKGRLLAFGLLIVVALLVPASAAQAGLPPLSPFPPLTPIFPPWHLPSLTVSLPATVTGYVKNGIGDPIPNTTVEIHGETSSTAIEAQNFTQRAVTGSDGQFVITDVIQGTYQMAVNDPNASPTVGAYREDWPWHDDSGGLADTRHFVAGGSTVNVGDITLKTSGTVNGRAVAGPDPVQGSQVEGDVTDPITGVTYTRWTSTGADGRFSITNAPPGDWSLTYTGVGQYVPTDSTPYSFGYQDFSPITISAPETFSLAEGATVTRTAHPFELGQQVTTGNWETKYSSSFNVGGVGVTATSILDSSVVYSWTTDDSGWATVVLPPGEYDLLYTDGLGCYNSNDLGTIVATSGGTGLSEQRELSPAAGTYAVHGHVSQTGSPGSSVSSWIAATLVDPSSYNYPMRRVPSNGGSNSDYLIRVPATTGFPGNHVRIDVYDNMPNYPSTTMAQAPVHVPQSFTVSTSSDVLHDVAVPVGGSITGTVTDDLGNPVRGVTVSAERKASDPSLDPPALAWMNSYTPVTSPWVALTDASGHYTIGGLPTDSDYKVVFNPDYNPGWPLNIRYKDYNRRVYQNRQLSDGFNGMLTPPVTDHDPVAVTVGAARTGIDTQLRPGGYVALHADGPAYPTGAVYCDVMYQVSGAWSEVDSGFTTGGTFQKLWKVLPAGHYRLDYSDYFGRGSGSWTFDLAEGGHEYASVLVPAPMTPYSGSTKLGASFEGLINGGMPTGGPGGVLLNAQQLLSLPTTAPPPPPNYISGGGIYDFSATGAVTNGVWTLTLPYNPVVPDNLVGSLRVRHIKGDGTAEILVPFAWSTQAHTLQIQTTSLSPFQVMFNKTKVTVGKPNVPTKITRNKTFTVSAGLSPKHPAGVKSVQLVVYKYQKKHGYTKVYLRTWAKNYDYRGGTQYRASLTLGKGSYRIYAVAVADTWHLATTSSYRSIAIK